MIIGISGKIASGKNTIATIINKLTNNKFEEKAFAYKLKQIVSIITGCSIEDLESQEFKNKELNEEWNWYKTPQTTSEGIAFIRSTPTEEAKKFLAFPQRIRPYTYREILQRVGTEAMRNNIHEDVWINALFSDYSNPYEREFTSGEKLAERYNKGTITFKTKLEFSYPNWIITDLRFSNELKAIKDRRGITIRVNRKQINGLFEVNQKEMTLKPFNEHPSETSLDNAEFDYTINNDGNIEDLIEKVKEILIKEKLL